MARLSNYIDFDGLRKYIVEDRGIKISHISASLGKSPSTLGTCLRKRTISKETYYGICDFLMCDPERFLKKHEKLEKPEKSPMAPVVIRPVLFFDPNKPIVDCLDLSVRSLNGLMRAGLDTLGKVYGAWNRLSNIRNLGAGSVREIKNAFIAYCLQNSTDDQLQRFIYTLYMAYDTAVERGLISEE